MVKRTGGALLLSLKLDPASARPVGLQLYIALRALILDGALRPGDRLPASRTVAADLGISRTTVVEAFERLAAEGLTEARTGACTFVNRALATHALPGARAEAAVAASEQAAPRLSRRIAVASNLLVDRLPHEPRAFTTALPAFDAFPMALWSRCVAKHWRAHRDVVMGYGDPRGYGPLRRAIATHLRANRAISCEAEQIFIVNGAQEAFQLLAGLLLDPGDAVWFENPGAIGARNCFAAAGARLVPVPVDDEGMVVEEALRLAPRFRLAFVTPSHQQPLGSTLSLQRRLALLDAARQAAAWIVEDDYDGEFCYQGHPPPTLKSIDGGGRVVYVGTFSKTLFPALRLGYMVAPPTLVEVFERLLRAFVPGVPANPQAVVADFMDEGHFAAHIRRMRRLYADRQQALLDAAGERLAGVLDLRPTHTGLHTVGRLHPGTDELALARGAWNRGVTAVALQRYCIAPIEERGLVLGFSGIDIRQIRAGVDVLACVLDGRDRASRLSSLPPVPGPPPSPRP
jgi:GntR family transcriptional regulator / MocR family aminotransferase